MQHLLFEPKLQNIAKRIFSLIEKVVSDAIFHQIKGNILPQKEHLWPISTVINQFLNKFFRILEKKVV